ncbi:helix-turn-helix domain-containing protein [Kocuria marina]
MTHSPWTHRRRIGTFECKTIPARYIAFGDRLRELRREPGWESQESFAHHVSLDRTYISGLERGLRNPTLDVIVKLAADLDVEPAELLTTIE